MRLALYQPDIPQNTGTLLRLGACLGVPIDIIGPMGFVFSDKKIRRSGMDYLDAVDYTIHSSWEAFLDVQKNLNPRIILLTVKAQSYFTNFEFQENDILLLGRESAGVPQHVHEHANGRVVIPLEPQCRSLNVAIAGAMVLSEALRQTNMFPK